MKKDVVKWITEIEELLQNTARYAWYGKHHLAHITNPIQREGWR